jgi:beta-glucosidase
MAGFGKNFIWGASTSAHQVEGGNNNDWSHWEQLNDNRLAARKSKPAGANDPANYRSGQAVDHYHLYKEDLDLAQQLGLTAYRFSVEWSRVEPQEGQFNQAELEHYLAVIKAARQRGMEPFVCLWHWTLPTWLASRGGWSRRSTAQNFKRFCAKVVEALGPEVKYWVTLNEPEVYAENVYQTGRWLQQRRNGFVYLWALGNLALGHRMAYRVIKAQNPQAQVGIAKHKIYFEPYGNRLINRLIVTYSNRFWNHQFLDWIKHRCDFIGLNYYFHSRVDYWRSRNDNKRVSDMGWELYPKGLYYLLVDLGHKYHKPIYIMEHGLADAQDLNRAWYISESLRQVDRALDQGIDVRGYFHWSLLDNFEWDSGFWPKFGLIEVDYPSLKRKIRPSAYRYAEIIKKGL